MKVFDDEIYVCVTRLWIISFHFVERNTSLHLSSPLLLQAGTSAFIRGVIFLLYERT